MSSPTQSKPSSPSPPFTNNLKDIHLKSSMNALKENFLRSKITKDYETLSEEIQKLQKKNEELEFENNEFRETIDYLNCEKQIIEEEKKETEDQLAKEIIARTEMEAKYQQALNQIHTLESQVESLRKEVAEKNEELEKLDKRYIKHRSIWEENERRAEDEIKRLDQFIDEVKTVLKENYSVLQGCKPLENLLVPLTAINEPQPRDN